jgi:hypothetical protein
MGLSLANLPRFEADAIVGAMDIITFLAIIEKLPLLRST